MLTSCVVLPIHTMDGNNRDNARLADAAKENTALTTRITFIPLTETDFVGLECIFDPKQRLGNELYQLIKKGSYTVGINIFDDAKDLIAQDADVNVVDQEGRTPLMLAAGIPDEKLCTLLLDNGAKVHVEDKTGKIALDYAATKSTATAELLVDAMLQAPMPGQTKRMVTVMLCFSRMNQPTTLKNVFLPILRLLLKEERELNSYHKVNRLLLDYVRLFQSNIQDHLLRKYFAKLALKDTKTGLMKIAALGNTAHCKWLLDNKKDDVTQATGLGTTALHEAARGGWQETCDFLISSGANVFCVDANNQTALHMASDVKCNGLQYKQHLETSELLVEKMIEKAVKLQDVFDIVNNLSNDSIKIYLLQKYFIDYKAYRTNN